MVGVRFEIANVVIVQVGDIVLLNEGGEAFQRAIRVTADKKFKPSPGADIESGEQFIGDGLPIDNKGIVVFIILIEIPADVSRVFGGGIGNTRLDYQIGGNRRSIVIVGAHGSPIGIEIEVVGIIMVRIANVREWSIEAVEVNEEGGQEYKIEVGADRSVQEAILPVGMVVGAYKFNYIILIKFIALFIGAVGDEVEKTIGVLTAGDNVIDFGGEVFRMIDELWQVAPKGDSIEHGVQVVL